MKAMPSERWSEPCQQRANVTLIGLRTPREQNFEMKPKSGFEMTLIEQRAK
jgi:hypothetical protein